MVMPARIELSERAVQTFREYMWTLLPGSGVVLPGSDLSRDRRKRGVRELKAKEIVTLDEFGCFLPPAPRVRFLEAVLHQGNFNEEDLSWLLPDGLGNIVIYDFGKLELVSAVAPLYATGGWRLQRIHVYEHQPMIAAAEYHHPDEYVPAYTVFCWATVMDNERELCERLEAIPEAIQEHAVDPTKRFWPAGLVVLAATTHGLRPGPSGWPGPSWTAGWSREASEGGTTPLAHCTSPTAPRP